MNPSYFRIKLNKKEAIQRLCDWNGGEYKESIKTGYLKAVDVSVDENGQWKGSCLYVYENEEWTVFEDLSGGYSFIDIEDWKKFAKNNNLVFAAYNDATLYAELIVIENGVVTKYFIEDFDMPVENVNEGNGIEDIYHWTDVVDFMEHDELFSSEDAGVVLIFEGLY